MCYVIESLSTCSTLSCRCRLGWSTRVSSRLLPWSSKFWWRLSSTGGREQNLTPSTAKVRRLNSAATLVFSSSFLFFFPSHLLSPPSYSLSVLVVTQIRGHTAGSSPPLPTTVRALHFFRDNISALLSSLVDSRRIVLTHARRSQQPIPFCFFFCR